MNKALGLDTASQLRLSIQSVPEKLKKKEEQMTLGKITFFDQRQSQT